MVEHAEREEDNGSDLPAVLLAHCPRFQRWQVQHFLAIAPDGDVGLFTLHPAVALTTSRRLNAATTHRPGHEHR